ncbi:MAG: NAD(P)H-dependent oxidoreductase [Halodesulfurarchaeum sp.]
MHNIPDQLTSLTSPIDVGVIGAGVFGTKLVDQLERVPGMRTAVIADIELDAARKTVQEAGIDESSVTVVDGAKNVNAELERDHRVLVEDASALVRSDVDVVVEATGVPNAAARHAYEAILAEKHVVMVTVEADTVVGPILSEMAQAANVTYSMAYGDQPSLLSELYDWAEAIGLDVIAAGKGNPYLPEYRHGTPDTAFERWGFEEEFVEEQDLNPQMYNSFLDGTKVAVEMCAVANATGLTPDVPGMHLPHASVPEIPEKLRLEEDGGVLGAAGAIETVSSLRPDGSEIEDDVEFGVFLVTTTPNEAVQQYLDNLAGSGMYTASAGKYQVFYRPFHLPGVETPISVANAALRNEPTGQVTTQHTEVVARAKRDLEPGEEIDGGGGYAVYGYLVEAERAAEKEYVPLELLDGATVSEPVETDEILTEEHVELDRDSFIHTLRRIQETT